VAAEEQTPDAPYVPHPISSVPAPDSVSAPPLPDPISSVPLQPSGPPSSGLPVSGHPVPPVVPRRKRRILLPVAIMVGVLVLAGGGVGLIAYDRATAIDRSTPAASVQQLLTAIFVEESGARIALFLCPGIEPQGVSQHARDLVGQDAKPSWEIQTTKIQSGNTATVVARITLRYPGDVEPSGDEQWQFTLNQKDGWRVCRFDRLS